MNEKITLSGVPETMLQTLYARAKETCTRGAIRDEKAAALVERIDYDFSLADKDAAMHSGVIARTIVLDRLVEGFLAQHQSAAVEERDAPALVIIEGLTMYLSERDVQRIFEVIAARFPRVTVLVETMSPAVVRRFREKSIEGSGVRFTWGVADGAALARLLPGFRLVEEHSLCEGMAAFVPVYRLLDRIPLVRNISNRIVVLERA